MAPKRKRVTHSRDEGDGSGKENAPVTASGKGKQRKTELENAPARHTASIPSSSETIDLTRSPSPSPFISQTIDKLVASNQGAKPTSNPSPSYVYGPPPPTQHSVNERKSWLTQDDPLDDVNEIVASSQAISDNENTFLYGEVSTKIVGVQYYNGIANTGEYILIRREPGNPYDSNAIRIDNVSGRQIGHIPRKMAEKLAPYIDHRLAVMAGRLTGHMTPFDCPLEVKIYGPDPHTDKGLQLQEKMTIDKLPTKALREAEKRRKEREKMKQQAEKDRLKAQRMAAATGQGGRFPGPSDNSTFAAQSQGSLGQDTPTPAFDMFEAAQRFNPRETGKFADECGLQVNALEHLPLAEKPKMISTHMLPYQLQALQWLLDHEDPKLPEPQSNQSVQLWTRNPRQNNVFTNIATNHSTKEVPVLARGGILADDMGLGKTLEMISLIVADVERNGRGTTLVVCPLSVMSNWTGQIAQHVTKDKSLNVHVYHGAGRTNMAASDFAKYDVVITTYQTLASDYMPRGKPGAVKDISTALRSSGLYSLEWRRVILDEGHIVRNPQAKGAHAVAALTAWSRWVLTGTPIVNSLRDLYALLRFIRITGGLETLETFNTALVRPLKAGDESAMALLQAVMAAFTLRRRKDMSFIDLRLPKLDEYLQLIEFTDKERSRYDALHAEAKGLLTRYEQTASGQAQAYTNLLTLLLRMRQCCNHWRLCGERVTNLLQQLETSGTVDLSPQNRAALQVILQVQIESQEDCPVCLDSLHEPVITNCGHSFGFDCITRVIENQHKCPMCRAELKDETCLVRPARAGGEDSTEPDLDLTASSTKVERLIKILQQTKQSGKGEKTVVFSQWTSFLNIVQVRLEAEGFRYCRIDGAMRADARDTALHALEHDDGCTVMLASLGVCAVGLNLTAASQIILSDTWWAPAIEDQAIDRVHRLGQTKETRVFRLVMEDSIEQRTLDVQRDKRKLMMLAFAEKHSRRGDAKAGRLADIQKLLA